MRWAVIGNSGMFGQELEHFLLGLGEEVVGFNRNTLELSDEPEKIPAQLRGFDVWVNCVAYTAVDLAETETYDANVVNGIYAGAMAQAAAITGARFIHISTDYVFDGLANTPYSVAEPTNPQTGYGKSKAIGELLVSESGADYSIIRTAWLYGEFGKCFPKAIANKLKTAGVANVVGDQVGQPTWTRDLAEQVYKVALLENMPRIVHAVSSGKGSWADFAMEVALSIGLQRDSIKSVSTSEYPTPAIRPAWSVLDNSSEQIEPIGDWRERWKVAATSVLSDFI